MNARRKVLQYSLSTLAAMALAPTVRALTSNTQVAPQFAPPLEMAEIGGNCYENRTQMDVNGGLGGSDAVERMIDRNAQSRTNTGSKALIHSCPLKPARFGVSRSGTDERPGLDREATATYENEIRATLTASMLKRERILASNRRVA